MKRSDLTPDQIAKIDQLHAQFNERAQVLLRGAHLVARHEGDPDMLMFPLLEMLAEDEEKFLKFVACILCELEKHVTSCDEHMDLEGRNWSL